MRHQESPIGSSGETPGITERFRNPYIEIKKFYISSDGPHTHTSEPAERAAERFVAAGPRRLSAWQAQFNTQSLQKGLRNALSPLCGRRSTQSLQTGLRNALLLLARGVCLRGAVLKASRKGCGTLCRRWPAGSVCVARAVLERVAESFDAAGPRRLSVWQAQYSEPPERVTGALSPLAWGVCLYKQTLQKRLRNALSPLARGVCLCGRRSTQSLQKGLRNALLARRLSLSLARGGCGTLCRRWPAASVCGADALQSLQKGLRKALRGFIAPCCV